MKISLNIVGCILALFSLVTIVNAADMYFGSGASSDEIQLPLPFIAIGVMVLLLGTALCFAIAGSIGKKDEAEVVKRELQK